MNLKKPWKQVSKVNNLLSYSMKAKKRKTSQFTLYDQRMIGNKRWEQTSLSSQTKWTPSTLKLKQTPNQ